jgi:hypothetical protein
MASSLSLFYSSQGSASLPTANQLYTVAGSPATVQSYTNFGTGLGWVEIASQGQQNVAPQASIGAPSGLGFLSDSPALFNQQLLAGAFSAAVRLNASQIGGGLTQAGTLTADIVVRLFNLLQNGSYLSLLIMSLLAQTIPSAFTTFNLSGNLASPANFNSNERAYLDIWCNITVNANGSPYQGIRLNRLSNDFTNFTGDPNAVLVTAGFQPIPTPPAFTWPIAGTLKHGIPLM